jgi:beta-phosphoglucomutase
LFWWSACFPLVGFKPNKVQATTSDYVMLRAIIFDCDGVIANTEPMHLAAFQKVLAEEGIILTEEEYYQRYLALDDRTCFQAIFSGSGATLTQEKLSELIERKSEYLNPIMRDHLELFPGVEDFIRLVARRFPLAIASGALRHEIELILQHSGLHDLFQVVISAEDVAEGKPHPEPFLKALALINASQVETIQPWQCLVIEDSIHGVEAAHLAGMRCLAVTNSYSKEQLSRADRVVESLAGLSLKDLESLFAT